MVNWICCWMGATSPDHVASPSCYRWVASAESRWYKRAYQTNPVGTGMLSYSVVILRSSFFWCCSRTQAKPLLNLEDACHRLTSIGLAPVSWKLSQNLILGPYLPFHKVNPYSYFFRSPEEAGDYVRTLQALLRSVGSSDGNMEQVIPCIS